MLAALVAALSLAVLLFAGLAAAQTEQRAPSALGSEEPALRAQQSITPTNTLLPERASSAGLPSAGRALNTVDVPAWVAALLV